MKKLVVGILAHVDAGKTTLSESILYLSGKIRKLGRVDNKDAYLDTYDLEKARGITIFSKQALFEIGDTQITLLDTPGHVDFSAEMERTLQVLDYAILVISGADGIQGHTQTLWRLLNLYHIPVFLFINKMDQLGTNKQALLGELKERLDEGCIDFGLIGEESFKEEVALCDERLMEQYLESGNIEDDKLLELIQKRKIFPCFFGSALKLEGVEPFLEALIKYTNMPIYSSDFGAKVFKITRDAQGNRLTHMKITGGSLKVKMPLAIEDEKGYMKEEKVNQIRLYSGEKFETTTEIQAGGICAVTGLTETMPRQGLGKEKASRAPLLEPVLSYKMILPKGEAPQTVLPKLHQIEEEEPELHVVWDESLEEIQIQIMGEVQIEILQNILKERFDLEVSFDTGTILYKETIKEAVEGVGHFEPLRHYAEVHVLLEPGENGSGVQFDVNCCEDLLDKNWQRLILTHLKEKEHRGVLIGAPITDIKTTLVAGRAHKKHTEGGDFREATYRAVRQGLKEAESILLEPYYAFEIKVPEKMVGRAMTDIEKMHGECKITGMHQGISVLLGTAPVKMMRNYQKELIAYTKGEGEIFCSLKGYRPCHNVAQVIAEKQYDSERDLLHPTGSVFCAHGAGFLVKWDEVKAHMHIESYFSQRKQDPDKVLSESNTYQDEEWMGLEEIDQIIQKTFYANQGEKSAWKKKKSAVESYYTKKNTSPVNYAKKEAYLLVDGYNIIFAWPELKALAIDNMDAAKIKLLDELCNYQGIKGCKVIVVFDAYRVPGHYTEVMDYHQLRIVYTKEAETADRYIEKFAHKHADKYQITVATSDGLEQIIIRGKGCQLLSARELKNEITYENEKALKTYTEKQEFKGNYLIDSLTEENKEQFENLMNPPSNNNEL